MGGDARSYAAGELEVRSYTLYFPMHRRLELDWET